MTRIAGIVAVLTLLASLARAQAPLLELRAGHLRFTLGAGDRVRLSVRGVPVIRKSTLYIEHPGWVGEAFLNQDTLTPVVTGNPPPVPLAHDEHGPSDEDSSGRVGTADYETKDAYARYRYEVGPDDTFKVTLTYGLKTFAPAVAEYDAGYINANLIAGVPFTADTVDGPRQGNVPLLATTPDQTLSRLTPFFNTMKFNTVLGTMTIAVTGNTPATSALNLIDSRLEHADWAHANPIFWLGVGSPDVPVAPGENTIRITYSFGLPIPNATIPTAEGVTKVVALMAAQVPYVPEMPVIPHPKEMYVTGPAPRLNAHWRIVIADNPTQEDKVAARELQAEMLQQWGLHLRIVRAIYNPNTDRDPASLDLNDPSLARERHGPGGRDWDGGIIFLGRIEDFNRLASAAEFRAKRPAEGYEIEVNPTDIDVLGYDARGVYNGAQTLKQLMRADANGVYLKPVNITDWPSLSFRGVHWFGGPQSWPFHKQMIDRIAAPLKLNAMVYQADYAQWKSQPGIWNAERSTPLDQMRKTVDYARAHFIEPIPLVNGMGHAEWLFGNGQNLDIAADPKVPYAYNPEHPESYERLFAVYDEAIDIFHPKTFHIGNDEVGDRGQFPPAGVTKTTTQLMIEDTNRRHDYLAAKGIKTMMWGDMLLHKSEAEDAANAPTPGDSAARRAGIPKDIIVADWHYSREDPAFPSLAALKDFPVVGTVWYRPITIQNFARAIVENKQMGLLVSSWQGYSMFPDIIKGPEGSHFFGYVTAAEYAWNGGQPALDQLGYNPDDAFMALWDRKPVDLATHPGFTVDVSGQSNAAMWDWTRVLPGAAPVQAPVKPMPTGRVSLNGTAFQVSRPVWLAGALNPAGAWPESVTVTMGDRKAGALACLWGTTNTAEMGTDVASLRVMYADGSTAIVPIRYGREIFAFDDQRAGTDAATVWRGTSPFGVAVSLRRWTWTNPTPANAIASVTITSQAGEAAPVVLGVTAIG